MIFTNILKVWFLDGITYINKIDILKNHKKTEVKLEKLIINTKTTFSLFSYL